MANAAPRDDVNYLLCTEYPFEVIDYLRYIH